MTVRQIAWRWCYEGLARLVRGPEWAFMNYGYADDEPPPTLRPEDAADVLCIQLYRHVLTGVDVRGADVLEVGSGRGGGSSWVARYLQPRSVTGVDLSVEAVRLARRHRRAQGLRFLAGDAQALPLPDRSVDVVLNVESSHCYSSVPRFLAEVRRVLRPGGHLLLADLRDRRELDELRDQLRGSGLALVAERDITAAVLRALDLDSARKTALMRAWIPRPLHGAVGRFAALRGSRTYARFAAGELRYLSAHLTRPLDDPIQGRPA